MRRVHRLLETVSGRLVAARVLGLRLGEPWVQVPVSPLEAAALVIPGLGHAENGVTAPLVERIGRWASATIDP